MWLHSKFGLFVGSQMLTQNRQHLLIREASSRRKKKVLSNVQHHGALFVKAE